MAKVSVIIPVYNTEKYLRRCLDSVCNQTLRDIEIICINDCSTDNSLSILEEYAGNDNRIKLIDFKENKGAAVARNTGIDMAEGEYIGFVDSDDFVDLDFYEKLYNKAVETGADAVKGNVYDYDPISNYSRLSDFYNINHNIKKNIAYFLYAFTSAIYNSTFIKKNSVLFPDNVKFFEDPYFSIIAGLYYQTIEIDDSAKYYYLKRSNSTCGTIDNSTKIIHLTESIKQIFDKLNAIHPQENHYKIVVNFLLGSMICQEHCSTSKNLKVVLECLIYLIKNCQYNLDNMFFTHMFKMFQPLNNHINILTDYVNYITNNLIKNNQNNQSIILISVVNDYPLYNKFFQHNPFVNTSENITCKNFDNTYNNITITKRYNTFLNDYDYSKDAWFVFCHCDWELLDDINKKLEHLDKNALYGPIGSKLEKYNDKYMQNLEGYCQEKRRDGSGLRGIGNKEKQPKLVDTFDCQALIVHSSLINKYKLRFDENLEWDLYVEDFCINAKLKHNINSYAIYLECCHWSNAGYKELPSSYYNKLEYLNKKYSNDVFAGTCSLIGGKSVKLLTSREVLFYKIRKQHDDKR